MGEHVYAPGDRPDVEVLVDGSWYPGELRGWWDRGGRRLMNVSWRSQPGMTRLQTVVADRVRLEPSPDDVRRPGSGEGAD